MVDALGYRRKFGVPAPSTITVSQLGLDGTRPRGVASHFACIPIEDRIDGLGSILAEH